MPSRLHLPSTIQLAPSSVESTDRRENEPCVIPEGIRRFEPHLGRLADEPPADVAAPPELALIFGDG